MSTDTFAYLFPQEGHRDEAQPQTPLAFALALGLLFLGALFGISRLNNSLDVYEHQVLGTVAAHKKVAQIDARFSTAIQE